MRVGARVAALLAVRSTDAAAAAAADEDDHGDDGDSAEGGPRGKGKQHGELAHLAGSFRRDTHWLGLLRSYDGMTRAAGVGVRERKH